MSNLPPLPEFSHFLENSTHEMQRDAIRAFARSFAEEAVRLERERCAEICEAQADRFMQGSPMEGNKPYAATECAIAIRARSQEGQG
jgi:hypothetical protein